MNEIIKKLCLNESQVYKMCIVEGAYILKKEKSSCHYATKEMLEILSKLDSMGIQYKIDSEMNIELVFQ